MITIVIFDEAEGIKRLRGPLPQAIPVSRRRSKDVQHDLLAYLKGRH